MGGLRSRARLRNLRSFVTHPNIQLRFTNVPSNHVHHPALFNYWHDNSALVLLRVWNEFAFVNGGAPVPHKTAAHSRRRSERANPVDICPIIIEPVVNGGRVKCLLLIQLFDANCRSVLQRPVQASYSKPSQPPVAVESTRCTQRKMPFACGNTVERGPLIHVSRSGMYLDWTDHEGLSRSRASAGRSGH